jgi:uncharacterized protein YciI
VIAVVFTRGPAWDDARPIREQDGVDGHIAWVQAHRDDGTEIIEAGPFHDSESPIVDNLVGLCLLALDDVEEARALVEEDPAVQTGAYAFRLYPWGDVALRRPAS